MFKQLTIITFLFLVIISGYSQHDLKDFEGNWEGVLPNSSCLNFDISIEVLNASTYHLVISNDNRSINKKIVSKTKDQIELSLDENTHVKLSYSKNTTEITGFITSGIMMYHLNLKKIKNNFYKGVWSPLMVNRLESQSVYLGVENNDDGSVATYPFFGDQRFTGTWSGDFVKQGDVISFRDYKTGLKFKSTLYTDKIQLEIILSEKTMAVTNLHRSEVDISTLRSVSPPNQNTKKPSDINDGWIPADLQDFGIEVSPLVEMIDKINSKALENTNSVLIAKGGKLVFEAYFDGFNANTLHDQRSASKSISSAIIGIAIDDHIIKNEDQYLYDLLSEENLYTKDTLKAKIKIKDLLTMSSGLDAIDFGIERNSIASEYNYQNSNNWLKTVLEAPMIYEPGKHANYASANPFLLGVVIDNALDQQLEDYMDQKLFSPLGITDYIIQTDNTASTPYFGGGMYLTPRDMLKFGQLYLNEGVWNGQQVIPEKWVKDSFKKHLTLENTYDMSKYGYLWWHKTYTVNNKEIESIEARGSGGQNIIVIPVLNTVVVITSGNYRNGKYQQPQKIVEEYILPAMVK